MRELIGLHYSPWTERDLWVLDHHGLPYRYHDHVMIFEMPALRWKMRRFFGDLTVPAMIEHADGKTLRFFDSWEIAVHADRMGGAPKLFPQAHLGDILRCNERSERALDAGRALLIDRMLKNREALLAALPPFIPAGLRKHLLFMAKIGVNYVAREFNIRAKSAAQHEANLRIILTALRKALKEAKSDFLLGEFSYADITMAVALQFVNPVSDEFKKISPALRQSWTHAELAREFPDLCEWRDRVYRAHRKGLP